MVGAGAGAGGHSGGSIVAEGSARRLTSVKESWLDAPSGEGETQMVRLGYAVFAAGLLIAPMAGAQQPPVPSGMEIMRACAGDVERLCPGVSPGQGRVKACMKEHISQLSAPCFDTLLSAVSVMYTVNSDLLFPPGGWQLSPAGQQVFANLVRKLAPTQENRLYVSGFTDSTPIGPELMAQGITSNLQALADAGG